MATDKIIERIAERIRKLAKFNAEHGTCFRPPSDELMKQVRSMSHEIDQLKAECRDRRKQCDDPEETFGDE